MVYLGLWICNEYCSFWVWLIDGKNNNKKRKRDWSPDFFIYVLNVWFFGNNWLGWKFYLRFLKSWGNHLWILGNFRHIFYELWIFDRYLPCKSVNNHSGCMNFWELMVARKKLRKFCCIWSIWWVTFG